MLVFTLKPLNRELKMHGLIVTIFIIIQMAGAPAESTFEYFGQMPEIVVTAPRYEYEDEAWSGLMETVYVTAPRYDGEDANIARITNQSSNQSFGRDSNFTPFAHAQTQIFLMIIGAMILIIVRFIIPHFLRKSTKPANDVCYCEKCH